MNIEQYMTPLFDAEDEGAGGGAFAAEDAQNQDASAAQAGDDADDASGAFGDDDADAGDAEDKSENDSDEVPEQYEAFTLPEGYVLEDERLEEVQGFARELKLTQAQAQGAVDFYLKMVENDQNTHLAQWQKTAEAFSAVSKQAGLLEPQVRREAARGLKALDQGGDLGHTLKSLSLDRHPAIIRAFSAYGRSISPPGDVPPSQNPTPAADDAARAAQMYPSAVNSEE